jgi:hypothetical protein
MAVLLQAETFSRWVSAAWLAHNGATKNPDLRDFRKPGFAGRTTGDGCKIQTQRHAVN